MNNFNNNSAAPNSFMMEVMEIHQLMESANGRQQQSIQLYVPIMRQILQALHGVEFNFIRNAEFYSDLKETLVKIKRQLQQSTKRKFISRIMMSKRDSQTARTVQDHVDSLCGRIFLSYAQQRQIR